MRVQMSGALGQLSSACRSPMIIDALLTQYLNFSNCDDLVERYNEENSLTVHALNKRSAVVICPSMREKIRRLFDIEDLERQLAELRCMYEESDGSRSYYTTAPKRTMSSIIQSLADQLMCNTVFGSAYEAFSFESAQSVDTAFAQLQTVCVGLPQAAENMKMLNALHRAQQYNVCCMLRIIYNWCAESAPTIAKRLVKAYRTSPSTFAKVHGRFAHLLPFVMTYVEHACERRRSKKNPTRSSKVTSCKSILSIHRTQT